MQIFVFNCANSRLRRYSSGLIYAGSYPNTVFKFNFNTPDWDISLTKTAVFSHSGKNYREPIDENNMCKIPEEVLHEGYFLVSVENGIGLLTNKIRIPVAPMPEEFAPDNGGKPSVVYVPEIDDKRILSWTIQEVTDDLVVPNPTDLNPYDEWTEDETDSEYIWEEE